MHELITIDTGTPGWARPTATCNDGIMAQSNNGNKGIYLAW